MKRTEIPEIAPMNPTKIVDKQLERAKVKYSVEKEQQSIIDDFRKWMKLEEPRYLDLHDIKENQLIIEVFGFRPQGESKILLDTKGTTADVLNHRTFSIARVWKAGKETGYVAGDFVKLRDFDVASIENPDYEMWTNNEYSKSNLRKVGDEPPRFLNNIGKTFGPEMIILNPLKAKLEERDFLRFVVYPSKISHKLSDVEKFLE